MAKSVGNYYKLRTKKWLESEGYQVGTLEKMFRIYDEKKKMALFVKRDQFASDLLAVSDKEVIFVQVKFNTARGKTAEAIREFNKFSFPKFVSKWIVIWQKGASEPEIVEA